MPPVRASASRSFLLLLLLALPCAALADKPAAPSPAASASPFPRAQLYAPEILYSVLLLHPKAPKADLVTAARKQLSTKYKGLDSARTKDGPRPEAVVEPMPSEELWPLDDQLLQVLGRTLSAEERKQLIGARHGTMLAFRVPFALRHEVLKESMRFAHELAAEHGAFLLDMETREYFTASGFKERRVDGWNGALPSVSRHITLHVYQSDKGVRAISLGMAKLGLPDLVVEQVPPGLTDEVGALVNAVAQLLVEGQVPSAEGGLEVALGKVKDAKARQELERWVVEGARKSTRVRAVVAHRDEGDPDNVLMELAFLGSGAPEDRLRATLDALFGKRKDEVTDAPADDPELEAVARKARARLVELRPRAEKGLQFPEQLLLKAGFRTDDDNTEFMWLEVISWEKGQWRGKLANEPVSVSALRLGSPVQVPEAEVVDYLYISPEGRREGGESSRILMRRQGN